MYPHYQADNPDKYEFLTDNGILYVVEFTNAAYYSTSDNPIFSRIEAINFGPVSYERKIKDRRVSETVAAIIRERCRVTNGAILFICDSTDSKDECRSRLFNYWNDRFNNNEYHFQPAIIEYVDWNAPNWPYSRSC